MNGQFRVVWAGRPSTDDGEYFQCGPKLWQHGYLYHPHNDTAGSQSTSHFTGYRSGFRVVGRRYSKKINAVPHFLKMSNTYLLDWEH